MIQGINVATVIVTFVKFISRNIYKVLSLGTNCRIFEIPHRNFIFVRIFEVLYLSIKPQRRQFGIYSAADMLPYNENCALFEKSMKLLA